jgi:hypothetical protein
MVWVNDVFVGEGTTDASSTSSERWVFGDSSSGMSYGAYIDWAIWDETMAHNMEMSPALPDSLDVSITDTVEFDNGGEEPTPEWTVYDASSLPLDAGFSAGSSNTANGSEILEVVDDADNAGNKLLNIISDTEAKWYWSSPKFSDDFVPGEGFTVIMRAKGISADYDKVTEIEMKGGDVREKLRIQTNDIVNFEKSDKMDVAFPEGISALDYCIYRVTFKDSIATLWINEVFAGEGKVSTTSTTDKRWVFGDSNGSSSYGALIDWAIWDETGAYAPGEGAAIPDSLVQTELEEPVVANWTIYDASVLPADADFTVGSSQTANGTELVEILTVEGNGILKISSADEDKNYWQAPALSDMYDNEKGFTVMLRSAAISEEFGRMTEIEMKGTGWREKVRISSDGIINLEKAGLDFNFPAEFKVTGFNVYRITFKGNHTMVWVNDVFVGEGTTDASSTSSERWVFGDSSSGMSYGAYIDWAIWDETMAHNSTKSPAIPEGLDGSFTDAVDIPTSAIDVPASNELLVYPNPASDHIYVKVTDISVLEVYNLYGQQVITERNKNKISLENITPGVYLVKSTNSKGEISLGQFVKK